MLRSLHGAVLAAYPRPVLLFYADDVPAEQYTPDVLDSLCPAPVRHLLEVRVGTAYIGLRDSNRRGPQLSVLRDSCPVFLQIYLEVSALIIDEDELQLQDPSSPAPVCFLISRECGAALMTSAYISFSGAAMLWVIWCPS